MTLKEIYDRREILDSMKLSLNHLEFILSQDDLDRERLFSILVSLIGCMERLAKKYMSL